MQYISTRGDAPTLDFAQATMAGLARDGGLYLPAQWPVFSADEIAALRGLSYPQLAARIVGRFAGDCLGDDLPRLTERAYSDFARGGEIAPLRQLDDSLHLLELFHGPTLAFKDFALQLLGQLFGCLLARSGGACTIIGATSGDTGSAAIEAMRGIEPVVMYMLHPRGRVSEAQRRQMTTVLDSNIHNLAVDGDFDDCQNLVKAMFNDAAFRRRHALAAVNSINWTRIAAQTVYYFHAALRLGAPQRAVNFAVPTGNFGNVFAGYAARRMGLRINRLIIGSNRNDILTRFFETGRMRKDGVAPTIAPSMDIQTSSNFERYLFELLDRDAARVREMMQTFAAQGAFAVDADALRRARALFFARRFDDDDTRAEITREHQRSGVVLDPHSAIGVAAARAAAAKSDDDAPTIALATAHPAKFADAVAECDVGEVEAPPSLAAVMQREEKVTRVDNDLDAVKKIMDDNAADR